MKHQPKTKPWLTTNHSKEDKEAVRFKITAKI